MDALDLKRCSHCICPVTTISVEPADDFALQGPVLVCYRCDRRPHPEDALFVPD
ncbi:MAG: hypothetical protein JWN65_3419 [Solirubrobacterales bacterium]|jgi:hypothetical protein|nr:hypothetical protein [Solirubrobacterales bacterium]